MSTLTIGVRKRVTAASIGGTFVGYEKRRASFDVVRIGSFGPVECDG